MNSHSTDIQELKKFAIILGIVLVILASLNWWREHESVAIVFTIISVAAELIAFIKPILIKPVFIVLTTVAKGIGWFNTRLLLLIVFYLIITPLGFIMRLLGKDLIDQKINKNAATYWHERKDKSFDQKHYEKQF